MEHNDTPKAENLNAQESLIGLGAKEGSTNSEKSSTNSENASDKHFDKMQENEIGNPLHESPEANFLSENTKKLNQRLSKDLEKSIQTNADSQQPKKSDSTDTKRTHEIGDPKKENEKENPTSDKIKPTTEADNIDRVDVVREHEIGDPETISKEKISADDSLEAEKKIETDKLDNLKK